MSDDTKKLQMVAHRHDDALQKCVYCPKLSRAACPVSNAEASETLSPWGKMSMVHHVAHGQVPTDAIHAESAWACSACYGCRERCDHDNEVAQVLGEARAAYFASSLAPDSMVNLADGQPQRERELRERLTALAMHETTEAETILLIGCDYVRRLPSECDAIINVAKHFVSGGFRFMRACCGLASHHAGDAATAGRALERVASAASSARRVVAVDPGCAQHVGANGADVTLLLDLVYAQIDRIPALALAKRRFRYHDPCQLGRGLGRYEEPRAILARITGQPPLEFIRNRQTAECSGGGGALPISRPDTSRQMAQERSQDFVSDRGVPHDAASEDPDVVVSACASSVRRFRSVGTETLDLMSVISAALGSPSAAS